MASGSIKWFDQAKGFGFVIPDEGDGDVFLHARIVRSSGLKPDQIQDGAKVDYEPGIGRKGVQAINISLKD